MGGGGGALTEKIRKTEWLFYSNSQKFINLRIFRGCINLNRNNNGQFDY